MVAEERLGLEQTIKKLEKEKEKVPKEKKKKKKSQERRYTEWELLDEVAKQTKCYRSTAKEATENCTSLVEKIKQDKEIKEHLVKNRNEWRVKFNKLNDTNEVVVSYSNMTTMFTMFARLLHGTKYWHQQLSLHIGGDWESERTSVLHGFKSAVQEVRKKTFAEKDKVINFTDLCEDMQLWVIRRVSIRRKACRRIQRYVRRHLLKQ
jgi:hypothetical protein